MTTDLLNGLFELGGACAVLMSVRAIWKDRGYAGLSPWNLVFFQLWGMWNLFYYPSINQPWSLAGGIALALANTVYLICLWRFPKLKSL